MQRATSQVNNGQSPRNSLCVVDIQKESFIQSEIKHCNIHSDTQQDPRREANVIPKIQNKIQSAPFCLVCPALSAAPCEEILHQRWSRQTRLSRRSLLSRSVRSYIKKTTEGREREEREGARGRERWMMILMMLRAGTAEENGASTRHGL